MNDFTEHLLQLETEEIADKAERMRNILKRLGWSQAYFARRVGVDEKTVNRWCLGNGNPVAEAYLNLCVRLLDV